jgi:hypothetical protein
MKKPRNRSWTIRIGVTLGFLLITIIPMHADIVTVPDGLNPGDQYRLAFVTIATTNAFNSTLAYYNGIVNDDVAASSALLSLGASWTAIVSTGGSGERAYQNTDTCPTCPGTAHHPIYNLHGELIAVDYYDLWSVDSDADGIATAIQYNRNGEAVITYVWTGTQANGFGAGYPSTEGAYALGAIDFVLNVGWPAIGQSDQAGTAWINAQQGGSDETYPTWFENPYPLYALSSPITVVPVPAAIWLLGSGLIALLAFRRKGRKE